MLRRLIGEDIELVTALDPGAGPRQGRPRADRAGDDEPGRQRARRHAARGPADASRPATSTLDEGYARTHAEVEPGPYVMLAVSDTGRHGRAEVQARIFEPFFTTKERARAPGSGWPRCTASSKQSGGHICGLQRARARHRRSRSTCRGWTTRRRSRRRSAAPGRPPRRHGDHAAGRGRRARCGPSPARSSRPGLHGARGGASGARRCASRRRTPETIHLLLTDVVMPQMSGRQLADRPARGAARR